MDELAEQLARQLQLNPESHETDEIHPSRSWLSSPTIPASFNWLDGPELQKEPGVLDLKILDLSQPQTITAYISIPHAIYQVSPNDVGVFVLFTDLGSGDIRCAIFGYQPTNDAPQV